MARNFWQLLQNGPLRILLEWFHTVGEDFLLITGFVTRFFPPYFSCPFCRFSILVFLTFSSIFSTPSWKLRSALFVLELRHLFYCLLLIQSKKNCQIVEEIWTMIERVVNSKDLRRQPRSGWPFFHKLCEKYYRKSCKYMCNNSKKQKGKKISTSHYRSEFRAQRYGYKLPKTVGKPWFEQGGAHFMQACVRRICKLYTKGGSGGKLTSCEPPRDQLHYRRRDNIQRSSPQNTGRAKTVTTLRLEECDFGQALGARTCHTSPLRNVRKHTRRHSGC